MIIDCVSDLHGFYPKLDGGDLLILCGDYTASDKAFQWTSFFQWLKKQDYKKKILIAGNHDNFIMTRWPKNQREADDLKDIQAILEPDAYDHDFKYLCDSGTEFEGLKIWGSPWTKTFLGMNPKCRAFTLDTEEALAEKWSLIPSDTDILITHSPPYGVRDRAKKSDRLGYECVGSKSLQARSLELNLKLWVVGHIHEAYGREPPGGILGGLDCKIINASHVNEQYEPVNKPIRMIL